MLKLTDINPRFRAMLETSNVNTQNVNSRDLHLTSVSKDKNGNGIETKRAITFVRQVVALCIYPQLFEADTIPGDAKSRARKFLSFLPSKAMGSYGSYPGVQITRLHIADYISKRDGHFCIADDIVTFTGSTEGFNCFMELFASGEVEHLNAGIMVPLPLDPKYRDVIKTFNMDLVSYYLDEENGWCVGKNELKRAISEARGTCIPKILLVINPNALTGQLLSRSVMEEIVNFAYDENLLIIADESFQCNVYSEEVPFLSFKKVLMEMSECNKNQALISLNSISHGYIREGGLRGGYCELKNINDDIRICMRKLMGAVNVPLTAQVVLDVMANPPSPDEPSYEQYYTETKSVVSNLTKKAYIASNILQSTKGIESKPIVAGLTAFPKLLIPEKALLAAESICVGPDVFYCSMLAENTGIIAIPGSTFGIKYDNPHINLAFDVDDVEEEFSKFKNFHEQFIREFG